MSNVLEESNKKNCKRTNYLQWHDFFAATAVLTAQRCKKNLKNPSAVVVINERKIIIATGYDTKQENSEEVIHAELNAIRNSKVNNFVNCVMYTINFPCLECTEALIKTGIKEIIYLNEEKIVESCNLLNSTGVEYWKLTPKVEEIEINFQRHLSS